MQISATARHSHKCIVGRPDEAVAYRDDTPCATSSFALFLVLQVTIAVRRMSGSRSGSSVDSA